MAVILSSLCRVSIRKQEKLGQREASATGSVFELAPVSENALVKATFFCRLFLFPFSFILEQMADSALHLCKPALKKT